MFKYSRSATEATFYAAGVIFLKSENQIGDIREQHLLLS